MNTSTPTTSTVNPIPRLAAAIAALVAWAGMAVHNAQELPDLALLDPEFLAPTLISVALTVAWLVRPAPALTWVLVAWHGMHLLIGGVLTVIPFPFLPFTPPQTIEHYAVHVWYTATQIPLLVVLWRYGTRRRSMAAA